MVVAPSYVTHRRSLSLRLCVLAPLRSSDLTQSRRAAKNGMKIPTFSASFEKQNPSESGPLDSGPAVAHCNHKSKINKHTACRPTMPVQEQFYEIFRLVDVG